MPNKILLMYGYNNSGPYRPGFGEVHWYLPGSATTEDEPVNAAVIELMNRRTQLMGNNISALGYRISVPGQPKRSNTVYAIPNTQGVTPVNQKAILDQGGAEVPDVALVVTLKNGSSQPRKVFMGGLPDALYSTGAVVGPNFGFAGNNNYQALFQNWLDYLLNGMWGFFCLNSLPAGQPEPIAWWEQSTIAPYNLLMVLDVGQPFQPILSQVVHVRGTLMGVTGVPRPVGKWRIKSIQSIDPTHNGFELDKSNQYQAVLIDQPGTVEQVTRGYTAYTSAANYLQGKRQRGVGPVRPHGRSKRPVRRQPF
jgi:hypothetical protein